MELTQRFQINIKNTYYVIKSYILSNLTYWHILIFYIVLICLLIPTIIYRIPHGSDVYTHLVYTKIMGKSNSIYNFYDICKKLCFHMGLNYPYGLWLLTSVVVKITQIGLIKASVIVPTISLCVLLVVYYKFAMRSLNVKNRERYALLSLVMLLSIPYETLGIVNYSPSMFFSSIVIFLLYILFYETNAIRKYLLMFITIFTITLSHTGTTIFLLSFFIIYSLISSSIDKRVNVDTILALVMLFTSYHIVVTATPWINEQYIDKGTFILSIGKLFTKLTHWTIFNEISENLYSEIFIKNNIIYYIYIISTIYLFSYLLTFISLDGIRRWLKRLREVFLGSAPLGVSRLPHSPPFWVIWLNPIYVALGVIGGFKVDKRIRSLLLSLMIVLIPSAYVAGPRGLRELHYFYIILPIIAAQGFYVLENRIRSSKRSMLLKKAVISILAFLFFVQVLIIPILGNYVYFPKIGLSQYEREGLSWLSKVGSPNEGATGGAYGDRIFVYGDKIPPETTTVSAGSETVRFYRDLHEAHFTTKVEPLTDLYSTFGVKYYIVSKRTFKMYKEKPSELKMDENPALDKIYVSTSKDLFEMYKYIPSPTKRVDLSTKIVYGKEPIAKDAGTSFLVQTDYYKVRISKGKPKILYLGNLTNNYFGDGEEYLFVSIHGWKDNYFYVLDEDVKFDEVILGKNVVVYRGSLKNKNGSTIADIEVTYEFFEKAFKRTIEIHNDLPDVISVEFADDLTLLATNFKFGGCGKTIYRTIYPNQDYSLIKDKKFKWIYIYGAGNGGILIEFEPTSAYPAKVLYKGLIGYEGYALVRIYLTHYNVFPEESVKITQWFGLGKFKEAKSRIENSTTVKIYPYPSGILPMIVLGKADDLNSKIIERLKDLKKLGIDEYVLVTDKEIPKDRLPSNVKVIFTIDKVNVSAKGVYLKGIPNERLLDTLERKGVDYVIGKNIPKPFEYLYEEGYRLPKILWMHNRSSGIVLLPVSSPMLTKNTKKFDMRDAIRVVDAAGKSNGILIFRWDPDVLFKYDGDIKSIVAYAKSRGYTFVDPERIAEYTLKLDNVRLNISVGSSNVTIKIYNDGEDKLDGLALTVKLDKRPKTVMGGKIVKVIREGKRILAYVSTDVPPHGVRTIRIET